MFGVVCCVFGVVCHEMCVVFLVLRGVCHVLCVKCPVLRVWCCVLSGRCSTESGVYELAIMTIRSLDKCSRLFNAYSVHHTNVK